MTNHPSIDTNPATKHGPRYTLVQLLYVLIVAGMFAGANLAYEGGQITYDPRIDFRPRDAIDAELPDTIMVGNSMLGQNVDAELFAELTNTKVLKLNFPGSGSFTWYLIFKNQILGAKHKPKNIIVLFRDRQLCDPESGNTLAKIRYMDRFAGPYEPLIQELTYGNRIHDGGVLQSMYLPLYSNRDRIKLAFTDSVKYIPSKVLLGASAVEANWAVDSVFADENMNQELLSQAQLDAEASQPGFDHRFSYQVERSYLPEMIRMAKDNDIALHFVRIKTIGRAKGLRDSDRITEFIEDLAVYLEERDVGFVDYSYEESIKPEHYATGDHLRRPEGSTLFTNLMFHDLGPKLKR